MHTAAARQQPDKASGGPALDRNGHVVAVNAAILPEFGGANIGVPVHEVRRLLDAFAAK